MITVVPMNAARRKTKERGITGSFFNSVLLLNMNACIEYDA